MKGILPILLVFLFLAGCVEEKSRPKQAEKAEVKSKKKKKSVSKKTNSATTTSSTGGGHSAYARMQVDILYYVNKHRRSKGLAALRMNDFIESEAEKHSQNMATGRTPFGHLGFEKRVDHITDRLGRLKASAENVAYGNLSAREVVNGWLHSPGHKRNIEGNYALTGVGVAREKNGRLFFTQIFTIK